MKNLVTGASGFIGSYIAEALKNRGEEVCALVRKTSNTELLEKMGVELRYGDLNDSSSLSEVMKGIQNVYHLAALVDEWISPKEAQSINVQGTKNLLDAAKNEKIRRFIFVSSLSVLGIKDHFGTPADSPYFKTGDPYIDTKVDSEKLVFEYYKTFGMPVSVVRPGFVFGPRDPKLIPRIVDKLASNKFMFIGAGDNKINGVYVENLAEVVIAAANEDIAVGNVYNVTNDSGMDIKGLIFAISDLWKLPRPSKHISKLLAHVICTILESSARMMKAKKTPLVTKTRVKFLSLNLDFDIEKTKKELGYNPSIDIEEGLRRTKIWMDANL